MIRSMCLRCRIHSLGHRRFSNTESNGKKEYNKPDADKTETTNRGRRMPTEWFGRSGWTEKENAHFLKCDDDDDDDDVGNTENKC